MRIELLSIFPDFFVGPLEEGIIRRARRAGILEIGIHNIRDYAEGPHRMTDDRPYGGGEGMVMKPEPLAACVTACLASAAKTERRRVVLMKKKK